MRGNVAVACALAALLCGCAGAPQPSAGVQSADRAREPSLDARREPPAESRTTELVGYFAAIARAGMGEQKRELSQSAAAFGREATPYARLRLGGLYAQPAPALRDDARALALLEPLASASGAAAERPVADLASLLYAQVAERQRLEKSESKKQDVLREQIEAMKSIERSIMKREERQRVR